MPRRDAAYRQTIRPLADSCSLACSGITDDEKEHLRQKLGSLIDQEDAQVRIISA